MSEAAARAAPSSSVAPAPTARRAVLAVVACSLFVDMTVYGLVVPFLPLHAAEMGLTDTATGVLFASYAGALLGAAWLMVRIVRHVDPRIVLVAGLLGLAVATGAFWAADSLAGLIAARACQGAAAAAPWIVGPALVAECFGRAERGRAMGITAAGSALGTLVGPPLGGALYAWGGYGLPFAATMTATALLAVAAAIVLARIPLPRPSHGGADEVGVVEVIRHAPVARIAAVTVAGGAVLAMLEPVVPLLLSRTFGAGPLANGLLFGGAVLCYALAAPVAGRVSDPSEASAPRPGSVPGTRPGTPPDRRALVCAAGLASCLVSLSALAWAPTLWLSGVALGAVGLSLAFVLTPTMPAMADGVDDLRGVLAGSSDGRSVSYATVYVAYNAAYGVGMLLGPVAGGLAAETLGAPIALAGFGAVCALAALALARQASGR